MTLVVKREEGRKAMLLSFCDHGNRMTSMAAGAGAGSGGDSDDGDECDE